ncbi:MAG: hypothetical protein K0S65_6588, partial [Labilithrix sp.]|nr:hypothetical protein [Labilithrix sp.]
MAPTEFRYWENEDQGWVKLVRRAGRLVGFDPAPTRDVIDAVAAMYEDGDPLADAFLDEMTSAKDARAMFHKAARDGIASVPDAPASLRALFADIETPPHWLDRDEVERGARVFRRYGASVFRFAGAITLAGYSESSVAKPLALTGGYVGGSARRRFLETASFWIEVSEPKGLERGAPGWVTTLHVRLGHAFVRRRLLGHPAWNRKAWGVPINQADALFTLMGGSIAPGLALRAMGFRTSGEDIRALLHFWRWVGHIVGVKPRWYPATPRCVSPTPMRLRPIRRRRSRRGSVRGSRMAPTSATRGSSCRPGSIVETRCRARGCGRWRRSRRCRSCSLSRVSGAYPRRSTMHSTRRGDELGEHGSIATWKDADSRPEGALRRRFALHDATALRRFIHADPGPRDFMQAPLGRTIAPRTRMPAGRNLLIVAVPLALFPRGCAAPEAVDPGRVLREET